MELKVCIRTPKGKAEATLNDWKLNQIKKILLRKTNVKEEYVNEKKDKIYWVIECDAKKYIKIIKAVGMYGSIVSGVFKNKHVNKSIKRLADSPADYEEVKRLIEDGTRVEIIKEATAQEMVEADKTMWQKVKETFVRK